MGCKIWSYSALMKLVWRNPIICSILCLLAGSIPWWAPHFSHACNIVLALSQPEVWKDAVVCLTQLRMPVLFALVNVVILAIWITSDTAAIAASDGDLDPATERHCQSESLHPPTLLSCEATLSPDRSISCWKIINSSSSAESSLSPGNNNQECALLTSLVSCSIPTVIDEVNSPSVNALSPFTAETKQKPSARGVSSSRDCVKTTKTKLRDPAKLKRVRRQASAPHLEKGTNDEACVTDRNPVVAEKKRSVAFAASKSASFPMPTSNVIVRDISEADPDAPDSAVVMREPMVIGEDELTERIEAFFSKFRENLRLQRQESLRRREN